MIQINQIWKKISDADKNIPNINGLVKKTDYNAKTTETENKIPRIAGLATIAALTAVENKIPNNVSNLVKKTDYDAKILDIENIYITTADYNKFTSQTLDAKINKKKLLINLLLLDS